MHNNFYFLRQLTRVLEKKLHDAVISECFSQSKDELIIRFELGRESFVIRASLSPELSCLSFPENFQRARKNSVDLFAPIVGRKVQGIRQFNNERSFTLRLSEEHDLLFKMHGNRTNLILFHEDRPAELFRKNISGDANLRLDALDRSIDWSFEYFREHTGNLRAVYFTFGKIVWRYLEEHGFAIKSPEAQWSDLQAVRRRLEEPLFYIAAIDEKPVLSLLPTGGIKKELSDPVTASNEFFYAFTHQYVFSREKNRLLHVLRSNLHSGQNYCAKNYQRLEEIKKDEHYRQWADLLMANLHIIKGGEEKILLPNFYFEDQRAEEIPLRKELSPQKNAELYYRKAKNQHIEVERLESAVLQKEAQLETLREQIDLVEGAGELKTLRSIAATVAPEQDKSEAVSLPYHEFHYKGFRIWVGKHAQANDTLTLKYSYKEDLWLHAKDVSGSHVLIKHQAGKNFPKDVIEYAAALAAYNSRRKNETLCPVIVTPRKFVRKRKGDPAGAVVVEREDVVMVEPARIQVRS